GNRIKVGGSFARSTIPPALASSTYNANNQQTTFGSVTETYDLNGNLATVIESGVTTTYTWNTRNQLTGISNPGFSATFSYDSFGRRTGKTISGTTTNFVYDGLNPVQEKSGSTVTANLLTGLGIDEFFTRTNGVGSRALLTDALGSTVALGDGTGSLVTQYTYEPFGVTSETGATSTNSYKYTGREDDGSGLLYYRARYYHPRLQRFIAEDPLGFSGGDPNFYAYALNKPMSLRDSLGLDVTITLYPCCGGLKHVGAGVNTSQTVGLYPDPTANQVAIMMGLNVTGKVQNDSRQPLPGQTITISRTQQQDEAMQAVINQALGNPPDYNARTYNCAVFVQDVLRAGGIHVPNTIYPHRLMDYLKTTYGASSSPVGLSTLP
ncbi:MAG: RHS repeat-associated core domain-containing protein, partial [Nitrospira sp.]|nr:RHS repeat-associated core domain-containing protein [Nitrospira sp.]